jgi:uncharacterized protein (UPF0332 family)
LSLGGDLLKTARKLAVASPKRPKQADLRRAVSTAYYALFHAIAEDGADMLAGGGAGDGAWAQAYRALDHGAAKTACQQVRNLGFPPEFATIADEFVSLQAQRHEADYDPLKALTRASALTAIGQADAAIAALRSASRKDRRAFAVHLLMKRR